MLQVEEVEVGVSLVLSIMLAASKTAKRLSTSFQAALENWAALEQVRRCLIRRLPQRLYFYATQDGRRGFSSLINILDRIPIISNALKDEVTLSIRPLCHSDDDGCAYRAVRVRWGFCKITRVLGCCSCKSTWFSWKTR